MFGVVCPQCKRTSNGAASRLVKDSCGHEKCRMCLLLDEEKCQQCKTEAPQTKANVKLEPPLADLAEIGEKGHEQQSVIKFESHTGVITCNGAAKKSDILPTVQNGVEKKCEIKEPKTMQKIKSRNGSKARNVKVLPSKRNYHSIVIPNHVTVLKDPVQYKCTICGKQFSTKSHIKYHMYCTGQTKPFKCNVCTREFVTRSHLDIHMVKHTGAKPFTCSLCQKSFSEKSKLKRHSVLHSSAKPYVCAECGKAFRSKESLKIHTLIHRGEKPYTCRVCSLNFNNTSNLNKHLISHSNEKTHMCDQCGKTFKLKWALTVHRRSHLRIRPFECNTCSRSFINNKDLQRHQLIHLETKAYNCSICMTGFRRKDNLYRHVKNTHPGAKVETITTTVKQLLVKPTNKPVDNPNAINVITASPACKSKTETPTSKTSRTGTVINGPLKLAFKTSAFKNNYNIHRDCEYDLVPNASKPYDLAESVNICQKILSPHSPPTRSIIRKVNEPTSTEICQKILSPFPTRPLHYETSFEHKKHAIIKNIKFKLPANYTNIKVSDTLKDIIPLNPVSNLGMNSELATNNNTYADLKPAQNAATSVIVNSNLNPNSSMHWRRRTSQNLCSKILEN